MQVPPATATIHFDAFQGSGSAGERGGGAGGSEVSEGSGVGRGSGGGLEPFKCTFSFKRKP